MAASELAEAFLIVVKRVGKWLLWFVGMLVFLGLVVVAWEKVNQYIENKPYRAVQYAELSLSDGSEQVLYALGKPTHFVDPRPLKLGEHPSSHFPFVFPTEEAPDDVNFRESEAWYYQDSNRAIGVDFDKAGGRVVSITCASSLTYGCPSIYGLQIGSSEHEVQSHLGKPASEEHIGEVKILRYPQYNLRLNLEKRRITLIELNEGEP